MESLTNEILLKYGFKQINNSMFRLGNITLQNGWVTEGNTAIERILKSRKAYKLCLNGRFLTMIDSASDLQIFLCISKQKLAE